MQRPALHVRRSFMRRSRNGVNGDRPNRRMRRCRHACGRNTIVNNGIIVHFVIIDHGRVVIDLGHLCRLETATMQVVPVEVTQVHERESARAQVEVEPNRNSHAVVAPAAMLFPYSMRRQRRPPAIISFAPPHHPGRPPRPIRQPNPAASVVVLPPPIMERSPAPRIIRSPEPAAIAVHPVTPITVRSPAAVNDHHSRLPAPANPIQIHPASVGRKIVIKVSHVRRGRRIVNHRSLRH